MGAETTDDASIAMRLNIEQDIQQTWGVAHLAGNITDTEYARQKAEHEKNLGELLAKPTPQIYIYIYTTTTSGSGQTQTDETIH